MAWACIYPDLKIVEGTLNAVTYGDDILDPIVLPFLQQRNLGHVFQNGNARCPKIISGFFLCRHYHRICHQLNIYGMNSVDVFATVKIHRKDYMS